MFFKKKVGKGVRGEGKKPPVLFFFFLLPFLFLAMPCGLGIFYPKTPSLACAQAGSESPQGRMRRSTVGKEFLGATWTGCIAHVVTAEMLPSVPGTCWHHWDVQLHQLQRFHVAVTQGWDPSASCGISAGLQLSPGTSRWGLGMLRKHLPFYTPLQPEPRWFCCGMLPAPVGALGPASSHWPIQPSRLYWSSLTHPHWSKWGFQTFWFLALAKVSATTI